MNYFDIGVIAIVLITALIGLSKGFYKSLASLFGWLISIIISMLLAKTVANMLISIPFVSKYFFNNPTGFSFSNWIYGILPENLRIDMGAVRGWIIEGGQVVPNASDILVDKIGEQSTILGIFMGLFKGSYMESIASPTMLSYNVENLAQAISLLLANSLLVLFTGILILIVLKVIMNIVLKVISNVFNIKKDDPSAASRMLGLAVGAVKGIMTCAAIFVILSFMINFPFLSNARQKLLEDESIVAGNFATTIFEWTDNLLETDDLTKLMKNSAYEKIDELPPQEEVDETFEVLLKAY